IDVTIEEGGLHLIRVVDNGSGMASEDSEIAFARHATSKIINGKDLFQIRTLGFRGEALPSISAVAKVECVTSDRTDGLGRRIVIEGGNLVEAEETAAPRGTDIRVKELFYNTPARLKYMKTIQTELGHVSDYMYRLAMAHPAVAFTLKHNGHNLLQTLGNGDLLNVIAAVYGTATAKSMVEVSSEDLDYNIHGYVSKPETTRTGRAALSLVINGRYIRSYPVTQAILKAYHTLLPINRYPIGVLHITMEPSILDVNVHPAKLEVRFSKEAELLTLTEQAVRAALGRESLIPKGGVKTNVGTSAVVQEQMALYRPGAEPGAMQAAAQRYGSVPPYASGAGAWSHQRGVIAPSDVAAAERTWREQAPDRLLGGMPADGREPNRRDAAGREIPPLDREPGAPQYPLAPAGEPASDENQSFNSATDAPRTYGDASESQHDPRTYGGASESQHASYANNTSDGRAHTLSGVSTHWQNAASRGPALTSEQLARLVAHPDADAPVAPVFPKLDPIGQLHGTYLVAQSDDGMYLIDQHAAHERINYEHYRNMFGNPVEASQELLIPITIELTSAEAVALSTRLHLLEQAGVYLEPFGGASFLVRAYPHWLPKDEEKGIVQEMIDWVLTERKAVDIGRLRDAAAAMCSCKASIKANENITRAEMEALLDRLSRCHNPYTCPHGRPILLSFSKYELEKMFKRVM
ncbi:MAG: DNA mismatch repair endonuclease MutL, partial [Gorillibacterium sp.]|nr:DNA mismatch repair endonuclease MutL [Gorillibacterium sp.]